MANQFLVEIHQYISHQLEIDNKELAEAKSRGDDRRAVFLDGKIQELKLMRSFFSDNFDLLTQKYF